MNTIKYTIHSKQPAEVIIAMISDFPFYSFVESDNAVEAYLSKGDHDENTQNEIVHLLSSSELDFHVEEIEFENWNKKWETHFDPVMVGDFCCIRADFHPSSSDVLYDLIINPKMAFGTGHHETTRVVISLMKNIDFKHKKVLDFGTGTGVLAILAEKSGAEWVLGIDHDALATENAEENIRANHCNRISIRTSGIEALPPEEKFDVIIANINLNVLTSSVKYIKERLLPNGILILSGVMIMHQENLLRTYDQAGFVAEKILHEGDWLGAQCVISNN